MSEFNIEVQGGSSVRLPTAGKYCEKDIIVTASGGGITVNDIASGTRPSGDIIINVDQTFEYCFRSNKFITSVVFKDCRIIGVQSFNACENIVSVDFGDKLENIENYAFGGMKKLTEIVLPHTIKRVGDYAFAAGTSSLKTIYFLGTPTSISSTSFSAAVITDIYVPWSEGEVERAPWGATKATIHYNTTYDANGNPIV